MYQKPCKMPWVPTTGNRRSLLNRVLSGGGDMSSVNRHSKYSGMCSHNQGMYWRQQKCRGTKFSREVKEDFTAEYVYLYVYVGERIYRTWWLIFFKKREWQKGKVRGPGFLVPIADLIELKTRNRGTVLHSVLIIWNVKYPRDIWVQAKII